MEENNLNQSLNEPKIEKESVPSSSNNVMPTPLKKKSNVIPIIIGVVVLLLIVGAIAVGYFYSSKTPDKIFASGVYKIADRLIKDLDAEVTKVDLQKQDLSFDGTFAFDTSVNLDSLEELKNFKYHIKEDLSFNKEIIKLYMSLIENDKEVIGLKAFTQDGKQYLDVPDVFPHVMQVGDEEKVFDSIKEISTTSYDKDMYTDGIIAVRDAIIESIDKTKITVQKNVVDSYNGKEAKTTQYIYHLDEETQYKTVETILSSLKNNEKFVQIIVDNSNLSEDEVKDILSTNVKGNMNTPAIDVVVTTTGFLHDVVAIDVDIDDIHLQYVDYNNFETIHVNDFVLEIRDTQKEREFKFDYEDVVGTIRYTDSKEGSVVHLQIVADLEIEGETYHFDFDGSIDMDANLTKEDVKNAKPSEDLTEEEAVELYTNLIGKVSGTSLEDMLTEYMAGLV